MELINALSSPETQMNGNFQTLEWAQVYGRRAQVTTGLTWGYYGGMWGGITAVDGTLTLINAAANYIVVNKTSGAISVSTAATNWNDIATYARVYKVTTAASVVSAVEDHRAGEFGIILGVQGPPGPAGPPGAEGTAAMEVSDTLPAGLEQGDQWYESDTGGYYMRYTNPDATETLISLSTTGGDFVPMSAKRLNEDGTLAAPGISWVNEPQSGFVRSAGNTFTYAMNGAAVFSFQPLSFNLAASVVFNCGKVNVNGVLKATTTGSSVVAASLHEFLGNVASNAALSVVHAGTTGPSGLDLWYSNYTARVAGDVYWKCRDQSGPLGYFTGNGGMVNYKANDGDLSDATVKENVTPSPDYTEFVAGLSFKNFSYAGMPGGASDGVIAQDLEELAPELVVPFADTGMSAVLSHRLQQRINSVVPRLIERIKALEEKLTALESR